MNEWTVCCYDQNNSLTHLYEGQTQGTARQIAKYSIANDVHAVVVTEWVNGVVNAEYSWLKNDGWIQRKIVDGCWVA